MIEISKINKHYTIRVLKDCDVDVILELCQKNPLFYEYTEARPTKEQILDDMKATPPGIELSDKYFFGFFERDELVAIMDLVDGYPDPKTAYIGFFMMNPEYQGKQVGTAIIRETVEYLSSVGKTAVRLAIDKGNPQSTQFWTKNGFEILFEVDVNGWTKLVAEKILVEKELKIVVLGTAAATSMPLAFCNCAVCRQSRKLGGRNIRKRSSIVINDELLIDLGPDSINACNMYGIDAGKIKYLLQTHSHSDHFDAGHFVTRWSDYATKDLSPLDIVCSQGTAEDMNHWINENESIDLFDEKWQLDLNYKLHLVKQGDIIHLGDYEIVAIDSKHDPRVDALVYIISCKGKSIFYGTDMLEISEEAWKILEKYRFDAVFLDQTYGKGFNAGGHPDAGMVSDYVKTMRIKGIIDEKSFVYATHISHEGNAAHEEMEKEAKSNGYRIAYDGMELTL